MKQNNKKFKIFIIHVYNCYILSSYCTTTFMIEAMSIANAVYRIKTKSSEPVSVSCDIISSFLRSKDLNDELQDPHILISVVE